MARPKSFDRQEALDRAMDVFWTHGYQATTMTSLRLAMGLGRQSLYDTFGDKDQLFAEALAQYVRFNDAEVEASLRHGDPIEGIQKMFDARVELLSKGARRGCLMMNSCVELSLRDQDVAKQLADGLSTMRHGFEDALDRAISAGQVRSNLDAKATAMFFMSQIAGMVVMAKNGASERELRAIADQTLYVLN